MFTIPSLNKQCFLSLVTFFNRFLATMWLLEKNKININIAYESFAMLSTWGPTFSADLAELFRRELATPEKGHKIPKIEI